MAAPAVAGPYTGPDPGASQYGMHYTQATQAYQNAQAQISNQRGSFLQGQGLTGQYDANGAYTGYSVDGNAGPGGGYQQMMQQNAQAGAASDAHAHALGFQGGLADQHREATQGAISANAASWLAGVNKNIGDLGQQEITNTQGYNSGLFNDFLTNMQGSIAAGQFNPASYVGLNIPGYGVFTQDEANQLTQSMGLGTPPATGQSGTPYYDAWKAAHPGKDWTLAQWRAAGSPGRPR